MSSVCLIYVEQIAFSGLPHVNQSSTNSSPCKVVFNDVATFWKGCRLGLQAYRLAMPLFLAVHLVLLSGWGFFRKELLLGTDISYYQLNCGNVTIFKVFSNTLTKVHLLWCSCFLLYKFILHQCVFQWVKASKPPSCKWRETLSFHRFTLSHIEKLGKRLNHSHVSMLNSLTYDKKQWLSKILHITLWPSCTWNLIFHLTFQATGCQLLCTWANQLNLDNMERGNLECHHYHRLVVNIQILLMVVALLVVVVIINQKWRQVPHYDQFL